MLPPGFEPGSSAREAEMLDRTTLQEHNSLRKQSIYKIKHLPKYHDKTTNKITPVFNTDWKVQ